MWQLILVFLCIIITFVVFRYVQLVSFRKNTREGPVIPSRGAVKTAIIIGSGGHTTEMLKLTNRLNIRHFSPRVYIMSSTDTSSETKIFAEEKFRDKHYEIVKIPRSRNVNQSYATSVFTTVYATLKSIPIMLRQRPSLVLCNGPGTCIPICVLAFLMNVFYISDSRIIFVESICRVKTLSLTGKILMYFANDVIVQWPELTSIYKGSRYIGRLL